MGGVCGKPSSAIKDSEDTPKQRELTKKANELRVARAVSSKRDDNTGLQNKSRYNDTRTGLIDKKSSGSRKVRDDYYDRDREISETVNNFPGLGRVTKSIEGEQVSAGWPSWLVNVAGEAIRGWIPRKFDTFEKLDKIGQGTYSSVYKGRDLLNNKIVALKKVRFDNTDPESVKFMAREILLLRRLNHPNIIKLEGLVTSRTSTSLYLVFEYMEHDLTGLASLPGVKFIEPQIKCYMKQLLSGLDHCHSHGVLHRDIKGSNLLINDQGILKIADFGLANFFNNQQDAQLTSRVVTLWYRPPELLLGATRYGVSVDLWSAGCILGELYTGKPIMPGRTEVEQLHKIFKLCGSPSEDYWRKLKLPHSSVFKPVHPYRRTIAETFKDLPDVALQFMEVLLSIDPASRGTAAIALKNEFFTTQPVACDPSSLPKYLPSKEMDAKLREEEARRQGSKVVPEQHPQNHLTRSKELCGASALDPNTDTRSMQRRQGHAYRRSQSEYPNTHKEDSASNYYPDVIQRPSRADKGDQPNSLERIYNSGPLVPGVGWTSSGSRKVNNLSIVSNRNDLSTRSDLAVSRALSSTNNLSIPSQVESRHSQIGGRILESNGVSTRMPDQKNRAQIFGGTQNIDYGRVSMKEPTVDGRDRRDRQIQFSGPLLAPSSNIEQLLKEHDRRIQEVGRRLRKDKTRSSGRVRPQDVNLASNRLYVSNFN